MAQRPKRLTKISSNLGNHCFVAVIGVKVRKQRLKLGRYVQIGNLDDETRDCPAVGILRQQSRLGKLIFQIGADDGRFGNALIASL